ncbi:hypothetical protein IQ255_10665 [Pleurocapsales cyanobacterium LEGE 10410]|nr:hypothetical protein [Pleurocapsales cyanobacterium LEGE 10410]
MKRKISNSIKFVSTVLITSALGLVWVNWYLHLHHQSLPTQLNSIYWVGIIALIVHGIEGLVAAFKANARNEQAIAYGIYTFFVGYIGLKELSDRQ